MLLFLGAPQPVPNKCCQDVATISAPPDFHGIVRSYKKTLSVHSTLQVSRIACKACGSSMPWHKHKHTSSLHPLYQAAYHPQHSMLKKNLDTPSCVHCHTIFSHWPLARCGRCAKQQHGTTTAPSSTQSAFHQQSTKQ